MHRIVMAHLAQYAPAGRGLVLFAVLGSSSVLARTDGDPVRTVAGASEGLSRRVEQDVPASRTFTTLIVQYTISDAEDEASVQGKTLYIDRANTRWAEYELRAGRSSLSMSDGTWLYEVNLDARTGTKRWKTKYLASSGPDGWSDELFAEARAEKTGTDEIAGLTCDRWEMKDDFSTETTWVWNGVSMGTEWGRGESKRTERAIHVEIDPIIPEERFRMPDSITLTEMDFPGIDLLKSMGSDQEIPAGESTFDRSKYRLGQDSFTFPSAAAFRDPFADHLLGGPASRLDLDRSVTLIGGLLWANQAAGSAGAAYAGRNAPAGSSALLRPPVPVEEQVWWMVVPRIMSELAPLFETTDWSEDQLATARTAARFLALKPYGPRLNFTSGDEKAWHAELELLGRWFLHQTQRPELYAATICTIDKGPYAGLVDGSGQPPHLTQTVALDETRTLRLGTTSGSDPFVLQCVEGDKVLWTRCISDAPDRTVTDVEFAEEPPAQLGPFGWRVEMGVKWQYGHERAHLYLDRDAGFLFYFLSW
jgi:hypothetical protein